MEFGDHLGDWYLPSSLPYALVIKSNLNTIYQGAQHDPLRQRHPKSDVVQPTRQRAGLHLRRPRKERKKTSFLLRQRDSRQLCRERVSSVRSPPKPIHLTRMLTITSSPTANTTTQSPASTSPSASSSTTQIAASSGIPPSTPTLTLTTPAQRYSPHQARTSPSAGWTLMVGGAMTNLLGSRKYSVRPSMWLDRTGRSLRC